jgi:hypothetical protein
MVDSNGGSFRSWQKASEDGFVHGRQLERMDMFMAES